MSLRLRLAMTVAAAALFIAGCSGTSAGSGATAASPASSASNSASMQSTSAAASGTPASAPASPATPTADSAGSAAQTAPTSDAPASPTAAPQASPTPSSSAGPAGDATTAFGANPASAADCANTAFAYGAVTNSILPVLQQKTGPTPFDAQPLIKAATAGKSSVPTELASDFTVFEKAGQQLVGKDLTAAGTVLNGPEVSKAMAHIDSFLTNRC